MANVQGTKLTTSAEKTRGGKNLYTQSLSEGKSFSVAILTIENMEAS
jgi:hypothetical protein